MLQIRLSHYGTDYFCVFLINFKLETIIQGELYEWIYSIKTLYRAQQLVNPIVNCQKAQNSQ